MATKLDLKIEPLGDRVVVKPEKEEKVTASGIILADTGGKEKPEKGTVVAVGPGRHNEDGDGRIPMDVKKGDKVYFKKPWDEPIKIDGVEYYVLSESDITFIVK
ncbi:MAG TPA: co-chaperone GroES [Candidatus Paceibacterota bacterium]|nr:co-chaperone GroES [Candidatus Paceibacterota bacterium]